MEKTSKKSRGGDAVAAEILARVSEAVMPRKSASIAGDRDNAAWAAASPIGSNADSDEPILGGELLGA